MSKIVCKWPDCTHSVEPHRRGNLVRHEKYWCGFRDKRTRMANRFACDICDLIFRDPQAKKRHIDQQHPINPPEHICAWCNRQYVDLAKLKRHEQNEHFFICKVTDCNHKTGDIEVIL